MANEFGYCLDCCEMQYVTPDRNGVYSGNNGGKEPEPREIVPDGYYPNVGLFAKKSPFADLPLFGETS